MLLLRLILIFTYLYIVISALKSFLQRRQKQVVDPAKLHR